MGRRKMQNFDRVNVLSTFAQRQRIATRKKLKNIQYISLAEKLDQKEKG